MTKKKLLADIKADPARFYQVPGDLLRDRRLTDQERLEILEVWERDARGLAAADEEDASGGESTRLKSVVEARMKVQERLSGEAK